MADDGDVPGLAQRLQRVWGHGHQGDVHGQSPVVHGQLSVVHGQSPVVDGHSADVPDKWLLSTDNRLMSTDNRLMSTDRSLASVAANPLLADQGADFTRIAAPFRHWATNGVPKWTRACVWAGPQFAA
jgi:hypothetical protein